MDERVLLEVGRTRLETDRSENDYSSLLLEDKFLVGEAIAKSFFVGSIVLNCAFGSVRMNNTEFSEAELRRCHFLDVDLSASDFVNSTVEETRFSSCSFDGGEWRTTLFRQCDFVNCRFDHTTISLCRFEDCRFDAESSAQLQQRAAQLNTFTACVLPEPIRDRGFASRNFGLPYERESDMRPVTPETLDELCLLNNGGRFRAEWLARVSRHVFDTITRTNLPRSSSLLFLSMIIEALVIERRVSATTLLLIKDIVSDYVPQFDDRQAVDASMKLIIELNRSLTTVARESEALSLRGGGIYVRAVTIRFASTFSRPYAEILGEALGSVSSSERLEVIAFESGSTIIEYACEGVMSIGVLLSCINYALRQANVTLRHIGELQTSWRKLRKGRNPRRPSSRAVLPRSDVPALLAPERRNPQIRKLESVVRRHGSALAQLDEAANIEVSVEKTE